MFSSGIAGSSTPRPRSNAQSARTAWRPRAFWQPRPPQPHVRRRRPPAAGSTCCRSRTRAARSRSPARATGSDLADFLLGLPQHAARSPSATPTSTCAARSYDAYVNDDWRVGAGADAERSACAGSTKRRSPSVRPLVNLDVAPGFTAAAPVVASDPIGRAHRPPLSRVADARRPARHSAAPRRRLAAGSRLVAGRPRRLRHLPQHQRLSVDRACCWRSSRRSRRRSASRTAPRTPLTLANGFIAPASSTLEHLRGRSGLPRRLRAELAGVGAARSAGVADRASPRTLARKGSHLMQEFLPNTYPAGAVNPCPTCPSGFVYLTSNGTLAAARRPGAAAPPAAQRA